MEINGNIPPLLNVALSSLKSSAWREGQILQAVVVRQLSAEMTLLKINNQQVQAENPKTLPPGTLLKVEVASLGEKPVLKVLNQQLPNPQQVENSRAPVLNQATQQALPKQSSILPLLTNLSLITASNKSNIAFPAPIQAIAAEILSKLPTRDKIKTPEGLKQAIKDSGIFLENKLQTAAKTSLPTASSTKAPPATTTAEGIKGSLEQIRLSALPDSPALTKVAGIENDIKGLLLRLINVVRHQIDLKASVAKQTGTTTPPGPQSSLTPSLSEEIIASLAPPLAGKKPQAQPKPQPTIANLTSMLTALQELGKQTEGSAARTQLNQIISIPGTEQGPNIWSLEMPVRNQESIDLFHFVIEEEPEQRGDKDKKSRKWSVMIAVDLGELGPLHIKLQLENEQISTLFWAEKQEASKLINNHMTELAKRYKKSGIESSQLQCFHGTPPESNLKQPTTVVLDVNA